MVHHLGAVCHVVTVGFGRVVTVCHVAIAVGFGRVVAVGFGRVVAVGTVCHVVAVITGLCRVVAIIACGGCLVVVAARGSEQSQHS